MEFYSMEQFEIMGDCMEEVQRELEERAELDADFAYGNPWEDDYEPYDEDTPSNDWA